MAKKTNVKERKNNTPSSPFAELKIVMIRFFIVGALLIERRGLNILNVLNSFSIPGSMDGRKPTTEIRTTKKSRQFQASLK